MKKYQEITFLQGEAATEAIALLEDQGEEAALDYLKQWDNGDESMCYDESPAGNSDQIYRKGDYVLNYNTSLESSERRSEYVFRLANQSKRYFRKTQPVRHL